jgi:hypothetical protein
MKSLGTALRGANFFCRRPKERAALVNFRYALLIYLFAALLLSGGFRMSSTLSPAPSFPSNVAAFATEHEVANHLPAVLALTRRIFPTAPIVPQLECDAEMEDESLIVVEVDVTGLEVPQLVASQRQWSAELFSCCPSTHAHLFCLRMV